MVLLSRLVRTQPLTVTSRPNSADFSNSATFSCFIYIIRYNLDKNKLFEAPTRWLSATSIGRKKFMETQEMLKVSIVLHVLKSIYRTHIFLQTLKMKARILTATHELFMKYGIRSVSMDDIAKHISISKKTIYQYYKDKNEVVHELMKEKLKGDEKEFKQLEKESENVVEEVFSLMRHMGKVIRGINPNVFYDLQKYHPETWKLFKDFKENCILKMVEETLIKGIKQELISPDINVKVLSRMRLEQIDMGFNPNVFPPDKFNILDVQLAMIDHFLYGICTLKGHKLINKYKQITEEE